MSDEATDQAELTEESRPGRSPRGTVYIIEDEEGQRRSYKRLLEKAGFLIHDFASPLEALRCLEEGAEADVVLTDLRMPEMDGIEVLRRVKAMNPAVGVLLITAYGSFKSAQEAMELGADDYLIKPVNPLQLRLKLALLVESKALARQVDYLQRRLDKQYGFKSIIGKSPEMEKLFEQISLVAPTRATVLIVGESGTGKELIANAIHQNSPRKEKRFLPINCAAIPSDILESELFGHEKGSFTGALGRKTGKFELADGGTVFLDEIGDMSPDIQVKLLRVLEEREFMRIGGSETIKVDVRLIAATNTNLEKAVEEGRFRSDLYYRLKVITLKLPPLRERKSDIPLLVEHFLSVYSAENDKPRMRITPEATRILINHPWVGNIRELKNLIESLVVLSRKEFIEMDDLPVELLGDARDGDVREDYIPGRKMSEIEKSAILETLRETSGNRSRAAEILGIGLRTLQRKLKEYRAQGIDI